MEDGDTYRLLHGVFDLSPYLSLSRPYKPEPKGPGLILSESHTYTSIALTALIELVDTAGPKV